MIGNLSMTVLKPWWLILIPILVPALIAFSYKGLSGLGPFRRAVALLFRSTIVILIVLALAELQVVRKTDRLTTMYLLDASLSIPRELRKTALDYITESSRKRRKEDLSGVVVFGRTPSVESPPAPSDPPPLLPQHAHYARQSLSRLGGLHDGCRPRRPLTTGARRTPNRSAIASTTGGLTSARRRTQAPRMHHQARPPAPTHRPASCTR